MGGGGGEHIIFFLMFRLVARSPYTTTTVPLNKKSHKPQQIIHTQKHFEKLIGPHTGLELVEITLTNRDVVCPYEKGLVHS